MTKELIEKSYKTLSSILKQWEEKELPDDFFVLPYELNELVFELREKIGLDTKDLEELKI